MKLLQYRFNSKLLGAILGALLGSIINWIIIYIETPKEGFTSHAFFILFTLILFSGANMLVIGTLISYLSDWATHTLSGHSRRMVSGSIYIGLGVCYLWGMNVYNASNGGFTFPLWSAVVHSTCYWLVNEWLVKYQKPIEHTGEQR